ncbi:MAG: carbonic anhydrase [Phycisphaerae bacterium]|nr:carbonic anhydrase [Gemmatimonadaceae bacterium]
MKTLTLAERDSLTPPMALEVLQKGNERFVNNLKTNRNLLQQVNDTSDGQHPFAFILSCIDSRTSAELVFDQGLGDVFSCRIAGNVLNDDILGSMEFACKLAGAKVIVVLGHSKCGAVRGACDGLELGNLSKLLRKIDDAIAIETETLSDRTSENAEFVERVARLNVLLVKRQITERSSVLAEMIENSEIALVGGMYDVNSGSVEFYYDRILMGARVA